MAPDTPGAPAPTPMSPPNSANASANPALSPRNLTQPPPNMPAPGAAQPNQPFPPNTGGGRNRARNSNPQQQPVPQQFMGQHAIVAQPHFPQAGGPPLPFTYAHPTQQVHPNYMYGAPAHVVAAGRNDAVPPTNAWTEGAYAHAGVGRGAPAPGMMAPGAPPMVHATPMNPMMPGAAAPATLAAAYAHQQQHHQAHTRPVSGGRPVVQVQQRPAATNVMAGGAGVPPASVGAAPGGAARVKARESNPLTFYNHDGAPVDIPKQPSTTSSPASSAPRTPASASPASSVAGSIPATDLAAPSALSSSVLHSQMGKNAMPGASAPGAGVAVTPVSTPQAAGGRSAVVKPPFKGLKIEKPPDNHSAGSNAGANGPSKGNGSSAAAGAGSTNTQDVAAKSVSTTGKSDDPATKDQAAPVAASAQKSAVKLAAAAPVSSGTAESKAAPAGATSGPVKDGAAAGAPPPSHGDSTGSAPSGPTGSATGTDASKTSSSSESSIVSGTSGVASVKENGVTRPAKTAPSQAPAAEGSRVDTVPSAGAQPKADATESGSSHMASSENASSTSAAQATPDGSSVATDAPDESSAGGDDSGAPSSSSPPRRQRPPSIRFKPGERRRYPVDFLMEMRPFSAPEAANLFLDAISNASLSKTSDGPPAMAGGDGRNDDPRSRGPGPMRGGMFNGAPGADVGNLRGGPRGGGGGAFPMMTGRGATAPPPMAGLPVGGGNYDAFDLRSARTRAPPPVPGGGGGGRHGDPRGTGQLAPLPGGDRRGSGGGRMDGPSRGGMKGPMDEFQAAAPIEKLTKGDNAWARAKENDDEITAKVKQVRSLLNKLTLEKFDKIFSQIVALDISNLQVLSGIVTEVFEKTLAEPMFSGMYAELCRRLYKHYDESGMQYTDDDGKVLTFRHVLLKNCQNEFTRFAESQKESQRMEADAKNVKTADAAKTGSARDSKDGKDGQSKEATASPATKEGSSDGKSGTTESKNSESDGKKATEPLSESDKADAAKLAKAKAEKAEMAAKKRMLANVRFIGELFKKDLLAEKIIHKQCLWPLLTLSIEKKEEDVIEAVCNLLSRTGKKLSENTNKEAQDAMNQYFVRLQRLSMDPTLPARVRFMLQDLADQRKNGWNLRRQEQGAKTIAEIKEDIKKEERAKEQAQAAARSGRGGGGRQGGGYGRDHRGPPHSATAPRMTMASAPSVSRHPSGNRTQSVMDKYVGAGRVGSAGAGAGGGGAGASGVRLGPARGGAGQWKSAGGGVAGGVSGSGNPSLRPGGSRFGSASGTGSSGGTAMGNSFAALEADSGDSAVSGDVRVTGRTGSGRWTGTRTSSSANAVANTGATSATASSAKPPMEPEKLKRKAKSYVSEFWSIGDLKEVRECLMEELQVVDYTGFVTEAAKLCLDAKHEERVKTVPMFVGVLGDPISALQMKAGFKPLLANISDLEMDDPKASETLARFVGALAASGKLGVSTDEPSRGLSFLADALSAVGDKKKVMKLVVLTFGELLKALAKSEKEESKRREIVSAAYQAVGLDVKALAVEWNPIRGIDSLKDLLKDSSTSFLLPTLDIDSRLPGMLEEGKSVDDLVAFVKGAVSELCTVPLTKSLVSATLGWCLEAPATSDKFLERFKTCAPLLKACCIGEGDENPDRKLQMAALLETQAWLAASSTEELKEMQAARVIFNGLYDDDIVEEDMFLLWKEDDKESLVVPGKQDAMLSSTQFFSWLDEAETED